MELKEALPRTKKLVMEHLNIAPDKVLLTANFVDDFGADSLDQVELIMAFEEEFGIVVSDEKAELILTVGDAVDYVRANVL